MKKLLTLIVGIMLTSTALAQGSQKRVTIFGDSYSTFDGCITPDTNEPWYFSEFSSRKCRDNDVDSYKQTWWYLVIERMGWKLEMNNSYSGSTIGFHGYAGANGKSEDYAPRSFITRATNLGNPDIILICAGTNDSWTGEEIGEYKYADWSRQDCFYFRPAMSKFCHDMRELYPNAELLFMLNSELRPEINEAVHTLCALYGIPCLDLHDIEKQAGHPSQAGMKAIADQVVQYFTAGK